MHTADRDAVATHRSCDVHEAGGITGDENVCAGGLGVFDFFLDDTDGDIRKLDGEGAAKTATVFAVGQLDQFATRFGAELGFGWGKIGLGGSYARDSQNAVFMATLPTDQRAEEFSGIDASFELSGALRLQGEWVASNLVRGDLGAISHREGYYAQAGYKFLQPWLKSGPDLELLARFENFQPGNLAAASGGLKWSFYGAQHLVFQYSAFGPGQNFGAGAGNELYILQQQLVF